MSKPTVTAQLSFTGTAVYVYCIVPDGADGDHITKSDLTFTIDDQPVGTFTRTPTGEPVSFLFNHLVFAHDGLGEGTHHLVISSPPNGALLLDYVQVTSPEVETTTTSVSSTASSSPAVSAAPVIEDAQMKHRNSVSFAVAVGATVGTLSAVTFVLCLSLYCRRRRSARRARLEAGSNGPTPTPGFVPRFFTRADHGQDEESVSGSEAPLVPGDGEDAEEDVRDSGVSGAPPSSRRSRRTPRMVQIQSPAATAPVFVPRYFPGTVIPPPVVPVSNEQTRPALPSLPTQMPLLATGSALATPLPALTEEDEAALAIMADALPPPGGEDPPPFDPVRLPSYETATLEQTDLPLPSSSEAPQQQQGSLDSTRL
ncbi:hypothetical protein EXIGLDRAFT_749035 [Exidia glandulosa HHB12029]|uniref:Mid2 domain-containing protein n=1 Tax=Exidia glandulosa HHB12029 TaxID=1314781 RepID=A0A165IMX2_EXIGL|nr:hypothetical protein EXIGLDRAFT_749035 [Exidia glandulosa HHB12029]